MQQYPVYLGNTAQSWFPGHPRQGPAPTLQPLCCDRDIRCQNKPLGTAQVLCLKSGGLVRPLQQARFLPSLSSTHNVGEHFLQQSITQHHSTPSANSLLVFWYCNHQPPAYPTQTQGTDRPRAQTDVSHEEQGAICWQNTHKVTTVPACTHKLHDLSCVKLCRSSY